MIARRVLPRARARTQARVAFVSSVLAIAFAFALVLALAAPPRAAASGSPSQSRRAALDWDGVRASSREARAARDALLLSPSERAEYRAGGTWNDLFDPSGITNRMPVLFWVIALVVVGLIGLPYVWVAGASLPDRGFAFARPVGLLLLAWPAWWLASAEVADFSRATIATVAGVVGAGGIAIIVARRREFLAWARASARILAVEETVFWALFAAVLAVRWANPDLWHPSLGGEKPMDLAYLNAVVKSSEFPPYDPWFAGGYINYYYFGFVLVATLIKTTAIVPYVAYNLAIPTLAAFLGTATFGAGLALTARARGPGVGARALFPAGLAAVFVVVIGNLGEVGVLVERARGAIPIDWWYWNASRVISHPLTEPGPINEFPAFTYLFADLHAHAMALPYTVTALGLALAYVGARPGDGRMAAVLRFTLLALVLGALWLINTWDFPTYAALVAVAIVLGSWPARGWPDLRGLVRVVAGVVALVATAYVAFFPFHDHFRSVFTGFEFWPGSRTSLADYLTIHGFFLFLIASALVADLLVAQDLGPAARTLRLLARTRRPRRLLGLHRLLVRPSLAYLATVACTLLGGLAAIGLAVAGEHVAGLIIALLSLAGLLLPRRTRGSESPQSRRLWQMTLALVVLGLLLTLAVEYLVVADIDVGRTNTLFKTYLQVWVLWGLAAAVSAQVVHEALSRAGRPLRVAWRSAFVLLFAVTLLYPILATRAKIDHRFDTSVGPTLDGTAFMKRAVHADHGRELPLVHDLEAIRWMLDRVEGAPVVAEVNTYPTLYGWGNRFAMFTGNPAIVGWDYHQRQQRSIVLPEAIPARIADVQEAYRTRDPDRAYEILRRYGVEYLVVGGLERAYFPRGQEKWAARVGVLWDLAYSNEGVDVYRLRAQPGAEP